MKELLKIIDNIIYQTNLLITNVTLSSKHNQMDNKTSAIVSEKVNQLIESSSKVSQETALFIQNSLDPLAHQENLQSNTETILNKIIQNVQDLDELICEISKLSETSNIKTPKTNAHPKTKLLLEQIIELKNIINSSKK